MRVEGTRVAGTGLDSFATGGTVVGLAVARVGLGVDETLVGNSDGAIVVGMGVVGGSVVGFMVGAAVGGGVCGGSGEWVKTGGCRQEKLT